VTNPATGASVGKQADDLDVQCPKASLKGREQDSSPADRRTGRRRTTQFDQGDDVGLEPTTNIRRPIWLRYSRRWWRGSRGPCPAG
jgi:hypothetical protein